MSTYVVMSPVDFAKKPAGLKMILVHYLVLVDLTVKQIFVPQFPL